MHDLAARVGGKVHQAMRGVFMHPDLTHKIAFVFVVLQVDLGGGDRTAATPPLPIDVVCCLPPIGLVNDGTSVGCVVFFF